jgi:ankyrin repeat protein
MKRREFLRTGLLLGATATVPGVALTASQLSDPPPITGLVLPPLDDSDTFDLFVHAIEKGHLGIVKSLIEQGIDVNMKGGWTGGTPLHSAASHRPTEIVKYLILQGANVNATDKDGDTPLHNAFGIDMIQFLILQGANVNARGRYGRTPLHGVARRCYRMDALEYLVTYGVDVHVKDDEGKTALDYMMERESKIIERMKERSDIPEWYSRRHHHDIERIRKGIDLLRRAMG